MECLLLLLITSYVCCSAGFFMLGLDSMDYNNPYEYKLVHIVFFSYILGQLTYKLFSIKIIDLNKRSKK